MVIGKPNKQLNVSYVFGLRPVLYGLESFFFHPYSLGRDHIFQEFHLSLMKSTISYGINMALAQIFGVSQDVIQIYNGADIQSLSQNLVDVILDYDWVLEMSVLGWEGGLLLIAFMDSHPIVGTSQVQLSEKFGPI